MRYCSKCVMPDTKPDLSFDAQGICNACRNYDQRITIDWDTRKKELQSILDKYRIKDHSNWDCIIPISGGKDSTTQAIRMLELDMHPLGVVATTCHLSDIGRKNIENLKHLGIDCIEVSPNPKVRQKLNRIGLKQVGDISWPEHAGIFTIPIQIATKFGIPLLIWGENPQNEYGGPASKTKDNYLDRRWLEEFGGLLGLRVSDLIGQEGITADDLKFYQYPSDSALKSVGVTGIFLGYYLPWDGYANALLAQGYGFTTANNAIETTFVNYENLDNHQTGIHDYFKYLKFGFGRTTDIACNHIRRGRLTQEDGIKMVRMHEGKFPWAYLNKPLADILTPIGISIEEFQKICDQFTNKKIFKTDASGKLIKNPDGSPIIDNKK